MSQNKIRVYIATTIDGYIARKNDSLDWLFALPKVEGIDHGYRQFFSEIDTVVVGRRTYEEDLKLGAEWTTHKRIWLLTRNEDYRPKTNKTEIIRQLNKEVIGRIKAESQKDIWVVGGGPVITEFLNLEEIDEMRLFIVPTLIGSGIRLFPNDLEDITFTVANVQHFATGMVGLTYKPLPRDR